jgi:hypothetical protein
MRIGKVGYAQCVEEYVTAVNVERRKNCHLFLVFIPR